MKRQLNNPVVRLFGCLLILSGIVLLFSRWLHVNPTTEGLERVAQPPQTVELAGRQLEASPLPPAADAA